MMKRSHKVIGVGILAAWTFAVCIPIQAQEGKETTPAAAPRSIKLPPPATTGGKPLMQALKNRKSSRDFKPDKLPLQTLSNLLWAGYGINRPVKGLRTAPSAMNWQEIDVYAVTADGAYLYDAKNNLLQTVQKNDVRAHTGRDMQPFVKEAPLNLVFVANFSRMVSKENMVVSDQEKMLLAATAAGAIAQNVYLFCASEGLSVVVRGLIDKEALAKDLFLQPTQKIVLAQTVGYPK